MAFCQNCGKELADGAKFCDGCGTPVCGVSVNDGSKRVQKFVGEIRKCPGCGQILESFQAVCPACGLEITGQGVGESRAVKDFFEKYEAETDVNRKISIISTFPIPNTKEALYEFAIMAASQISMYQNIQTQNTSSMGNDLAAKELSTIVNIFKGNSSQQNSFDSEKTLYIAWESKFDQVCAKAKLIFDKNSENLKEILAMREHSQKLVKSMKKKRIKKIVMPIVILVIVCVVLSVVCLFL